MNGVVALQATATPIPSEVYQSFEDMLTPAIMLVVGFITILFVMMPMLKGSTGKSEPLLRPALAWLYRHSLGAVVERKRHGWRTFGTVAYRAATPATVDFCLHCEDGGEGFEIAFGRQWILFGFVVRHAREGVVRVCESCEVENQQTVDAVRMDGPGRWRDAGADAPGRADR